MGYNSVAYARKEYIMLRKTVVKLDENGREIERQFSYCDDLDHVADWLRSEFDWNTQWLIDAAVENPDENHIQIFIDDVKPNGCIASSVQIF